jgi:hypothetical protein
MLLQGLSELTTDYAKWLDCVSECHMNYEHGLLNGMQSEQGWIGDYKMVLVLSDLSNEEVCNEQGTL